jgi:FtsP/CotA-like multicopper oxidase with cupredoxin domain
MLLVLAATTQAQTPGGSAAVSECSTDQGLITIPEVKSENGILRAVITLRDGTRKMWGSLGSARCLSQAIRYFAGHAVGKAEDPLFSGTAPIPGPTLRARVGDLVEVTFLNQIDPQHFANSLDQANYQEGNTTGCDQVQGTVGGQSKQIYPVVPVPAGGDQMPNCLHGSSTANIHFHGTHTTPSTTGDNVLLFIRPALRNGKTPLPSDDFVNREFAQIFSACEKDGPPKLWEQLPSAWRQDQEKLLKEYDQYAPYRGKSGTAGHPALPHSMQLWPVNQHEIERGLWPQYSIGAYPFCFRLPRYEEANGKPAGMLMGQSPGTHWYHAHKHGSTALNVANGMTGAFIIEGQYDVDLHKTYGKNLAEQVLVIQQLSTVPFPVLDPTHSGKGPGAARPQISVNGRLTPVIQMKQGEVQLWRIVNGDFRDAVLLQSFNPGTDPKPCNQPGASTVVVPCVNWRQIAQDGVQFTFTNYGRVGVPDKPLNLAPANRADLLVKAPTEPGTYTLMALAYEGKIQANSLPPTVEYPFKLLTVNVTREKVNPPMEFIADEAAFPVFPRFLKDIPESDIRFHREVVFGPVHNLIDGKMFDPNQINQAMLLNTAEEWTVFNQANDKAHPFHIHINPFQIIALFEPNSADSSDSTNRCYADPLKPETWKPCKKLEGPFVWWDTFAIPTARNDDLPASVCTQLDKCPANIQKYTTCTTGSSPVCTVNIPGYFKMRSRFVDFTGEYVMHCHILIHEDRGMMQLIEVVPDKTDYIHD